jgi:hypothetical protein
LFKNPVIKSKVVGNDAWKIWQVFRFVSAECVKRSYRPEDDNAVYQEEYLRGGINPDQDQQYPPETGALLIAPKKAPPCRTETTFAETLSIRLCSAGPSAGRTPNLIWKYVDWTIPPAMPLAEK